MAGRATPRHRPLTSGDVLVRHATRAQRRLDLALLPLAHRRLSLRRSAGAAAVRHLDPRQLLARPRVERLAGAALPGLGLVRLGADVRTVAAEPGLL